MVGLKLMTQGVEHTKRKARQTIVVASEHADAIDALCALLDTSGCRLLPVLAGDPWESLLSRKDIALILHDCDDKNHVDPFSGALREQAKSRHIPLIYITPTGQEADIARCHERGEAVDYLLKPVNPRMLQSKVTMLLELMQNRHSLARMHDASRTLKHRLQHQVITDPLTGLINRHGFLRALEIELARARRHCNLLPVFYVDLDGFKRINDAFGHAAGDEVLCTVAIHMRESLRPYDQVAHLGGDAFAILAEGLSTEEQIAHLAEKILLALSRPHIINGLQITVTASIGIAAFPESGSSADAILRAACLAMQRAKEHHSGYRFYSVEMHGRARARLLLEESLRRAISEQEFELYFQPQMHVGSARLRGFEALLRWRHHTAGLVQPGVFVPVLEEAGFIQLLGPWIIEATCRQIAEWQTVLPADSCVSLNLSSLQFSHRDLVSQVTAAIARYGISPRQLEIEVTESTLVTDVERTRHVLRELRALGVRTAIDDFGTGYSSMAYLRQFELDTLKIDKTFVSELPCSRRDVAIAQSMTQLGHNLGMEIIAEGVETAEQLECVRAIGCDVVQGFYFSRPEPPASVNWSFHAA